MRLYLFLKCCKFIFKKQVKNESKKKLTQFFQSKDVEVVTIESPESAEDATDIPEPEQSIVTIYTVKRSALHTTTIVYGLNNVATINLVQFAKHVAKTCAAGASLLEDVLTNSIVALEVQGTCRDAVAQMLAMQFQVKQIKHVKTTKSIESVKKSLKVMEREKSISKTRQANNKNCTKVWAPNKSALLLFVRLHVPSIIMWIFNC